VVADDAASTVDGVAKSCGGEWENLRETERGARQDVGFGG
jgi:hypothetical protein